MYKNAVQAVLACLNETVLWACLSGKTNMPWGWPGERQDTQNGKHFSNPKAKNIATTHLDKGPTAKEADTGLEHRK